MLTNILTIYLELYNAKLITKEELRKIIERVVSQDLGLIL